MGIRFSCPNGHYLHVKSFLAGKRGICPHCDVRFEIPPKDTGRVAAFSPVARPPARVSPRTPALAAMPERAAPAATLQVQPGGSLPAYGGRFARGTVLARQAKAKGKGLVLFLSLLVAVLAVLLVFVIVYFGDG